MKRNLHTANLPDWEKIDPEKWNRFQRVAANTHGWLTAANVVSVAGFALVIDGLVDISNRNYGEGVSKIFLGRMADLADGAIADKTGTKSSLGEKVDVVADKLGTLAALVVLQADGVLPVWATGTIAAINISNTLSTYIASKNDAEIHPSAAGKNSMFAQWTAIGSFVMSSAATEMNYSELSPVFNIAGAISLVYATYYGVAAARGYWKDALGPYSDN